MSNESDVLQCVSGDHTGHAIDTSDTSHCERVKKKVWIAHYRLGMDDPNLVAFDEKEEAKNQVLEWLLENCKNEGLSEEEIAAAVEEFNEEGHVVVGGYGPHVAFVEEYSYYPKPAMNQTMKGDDSRFERVGKGLFAARK